MTCRVSVQCVIDHAGFDKGPFSAELRLATTVYLWGGIAPTIYLRYGMYQTFEAQGPEVPDGREPSAVYVLLIDD